MYFNHLNYPAAWRAEYSKYPEGLSILESLMQWIRQVDDMVDSHNANQTTINGFGLVLDDFIAQYDTHLQATLTETLTAWQLSGFLDELIDAALQTEMDNLVASTTQTITTFGEQLAEKIGGGVKAEPEDLSAATLGLVTGTGGPINLLSIPQDESVTPGKTNFVEAKVNIADPKSVNKLKYWGSSGGVLTELENATYSTIRIKVKAGVYISLNSANYSRNFSFFADANMASIGMIKGASDNISDKIVKTPPNCKYLCLSSDAPSINALVAMETTLDISAYKTADYPYNIPKEINIIELTLPNDGKLSDIISDLKTPSFHSVLNKKDSLVKINDAWTVFSSGALTRGNGTVMWTGTEGFKGLYPSNYFTSNFESVKVSVKGTKSGLTTLDLMLVYLGTDGTTIKYETKATATTDTWEMMFDFDPNYYAVYKSAASFKILVRNTAAASTPGTFTITDVQVINQDVELMGIFDETLVGTLRNADSKIKTLENAASGQIASTDVFIKNATGSNYKVQIDPTGATVGVPTVPLKSLWMGNSLMFGISDGSNPDGSFGMCASTYDKDFYNITKQTILSKKPTATFSRLHVGNLEQGTLQADYDVYITTNASYFTSDLDLIVLQIGDNVNTPERKAYFDLIIPQFIQHIRTQCPKARVIVISGWYNTPNSVPIMSTVCAQYGAELIIITDLNTVENQGYSGQIITKYDNSTMIAGVNWTTHPGDLGFAEIAERLIKKMQM